MTDVVHGGLRDDERAPGVLDLSANLHPDGPPAAVLAALRSAEVDRYPSVDARPLREALAARHSVDPACVVVTPGASAAIYLASATLLAAGDRCVVFEPTFGEYARAVEAAGGVVVRSAAAPPDFSTMEVDADAAWLCVPNNPTGLAATRHDLDALLSRTRHLLIDAAYADLSEARWDTVDLVRTGAPVVVVGSMTKLFAIPGVRLGYIIASAETATRLRDRQPPWPVGSADIAVGLAALEGIEERLATVPALHERRRRMERTFADLGVTCTGSSTNFVLAQVGDGPRFRGLMLARGVGVRDATSFGLPEWVRIAVPPEDALPALIEAVTAVVQEMRG